MRQVLEYVYEVYKSGSLSKAAEKLYITQPALSMAIKKIESSIGMTLFDRKVRPFQLTEAGWLYINAITRIKKIEAELTQRIGDINDLPTGHVRIGGSHYINSYILPPVLSRYSQLYPGIALELVEHSSAVLAKMLEERAVDLTFSCNELFMEDFERYPMFSDRILLAVPRAHPFNRRYRAFALPPRGVMSGHHLHGDCPALPAERCGELEFISLMPGNNLHDRMLQIFAAVGVKPRLKIELSQLATTYHLAAGGFAAAFVSDRMVTAAATPLCFYRLDSPLATRQFYALLPSRDYTAKAVRRFIQLVGEVLRPKARA
ncbi:LysR family transcriptional regulator [Pyramidobacter sp.]|uniref:LysR family transcriptional regulator n=1 Tax=Pyramidobacter sp. TaxID=1943581 RepID=UPI0033343D30